LATRCFSSVLAAPSGADFTGAYLAAAMERFTRLSHLLAVEADWPLLLRRMRAGVLRISNICRYNARRQGQPKEAFSMALVRTLAIAFAILAASAALPCWRNRKFS
jgi:hypothetical protein